MTTTISTDGASVYKDRQDGIRWNPKKSEIRTLLDKISDFAPPRFDLVADIRAAVWPAGERPARILLNGENGGSFIWSSASVATDDGAVIIKETATTTGRWVREVASVSGNKTITLEILGAVGNGVADDTDAFQTAALLLQGGWTVMGLGNYVISEKIVITADQNPPWQTLTAARQGRLIVNGTVKSTHNGIAFDLFGNQGGANGPNVYIQSLIGPGKTNTSSIGFRMEAGEHRVEFGECIGFYTPVLQNGCWSSTITYSAIFNCHTGIKSQLGFRREFYPNGDIMYKVIATGLPTPTSNPPLTTIEWGNGSSSNAVVTRGDHTGGPFMDARFRDPDPEDPFADRRPLSAKYGIDVDHLIGCHFDAGDVQYCQLVDAGVSDGVAVRFGEDTESCTFRGYLEGAPAYPDTGSLLHDSGRNNDFQLSATLSPDNVIKAIKLDGLGGRVHGLAQRTNPGSASFMAPERGAGSVRIRPGNKWDDPSSVHDHENLDAEFYNINQAPLSAYGLTTNCTYAALTTGLPDTNNVQAGATFTIDSSLDDPGPPISRAGAAAVSGVYTIAAASYDRPIYVRCYARLVTGPVAVAVYLEEGGSVEAIPKAYISQCLDVVGQWQRIDLAAIIPAGRTGFKLRLAMRTVDDTQIGNVVVDWAFPIVSWQEKPWSFVGLVPPTPNLLCGKGYMESLIPAKQDATVNGAGSLDCNYAPMVRITSAAANIGVLANLSQGMTTILNDTSSAIDINVSTGLAAIKTVAARRFVNLYKVGASIYAET